MVRYLVLPRVFLLLLLVVFLLASPVAYAFTLSFDDIPAGKHLLSYWQQYGVGFSGFFSTLDHRGSTWGPPHSGNDVLCYDANEIGASSMKFAYLIGEGGSQGQQPFSVYTVGAYFSTEPGAVVRLTAYDKRMNTLAVADIGSAGGSWNNTYVQLSSPDGLIGALMFQGISSPDAVGHFAADDMTIVPTPEPSSLLALGGGLAALGIPLVRRRRERER